MKFECGDLERALAMSELMPEAREHLKHCAACRREYRLWNDISAVAKELHEEWDSPELWQNIRSKLQLEPKPNPQPLWWKEWKTWAAAAAVAVIAALAALRPWQQRETPPTAAEPMQTAPQLPKDRDFLTEQALNEVERTEAAYRRSIEKLSQLAAPQLQKPASAVAVNSREKLLMLDSAIAETRANLDHNRFNVGLQTELANLYREKQQTLKELMSRDQKN
jgi:hypothetical protein